MKALVMWCSAMKRHKSYYHTLCQRYGNPKGMIYYKKSFYMMSTPKQNKLLWPCISKLGNSQEEDKRKDIYEVHSLCCFYYVHNLQRFYI